MRETGLPLEICNHSFYGTGITEYLRNGGELEVAAKIARHESTRITQLYNCLEEELTLDEIEQIRIQSVFAQINMKMGSRHYRVKLAEIRPDGRSL